MADKYIPSKPTIVEIRPIDREKWHNKTGKESFARPHTIPALIDAETMTYATGLTPEMIKELKTKVSYDLTNHYDHTTPHPFWDGPMPKVALKDQTMLFDISQPLNFIKIQICKASKFVANSMEDYDNGLFPEATHYIFDESEQADIKASKIQEEEDALIAASKMSPSRKLELIMILRNKDLKGQSENYVKVELNKIIKEDASEFNRIANLNTEEASNLALVLECIQKSVLRKEGHKILFHDSVLGEEATDVAKYLSLPDNNDLKIRLLSLIS